MAQYKEVIGDASIFPEDEPTIIMHICNDIGAWGAGFTGALTKNHPWSEKEYRDRFKHELCGIDVNLGDVQFTNEWDGKFDSDYLVANMIAQKGIDYTNKADLIDYNALQRCLNLVFIRAREGEYQIQCPKIGSGLAGGDWKKIKRMIKFNIQVYEVDCVVYEFPQKERQ